MRAVKAVVGEVQFSDSVLGAPIWIGLFSPRVPRLVGVARPVKKHYSDNGDILSESQDVILSRDYGMGVIWTRPEYLEPRTILDPGIVAARVIGCTLQCLAASLNQTCHCRCKGVNHSLYQIAALVNSEKRVFDLTGSETKEWIGKCPDFWKP
jgi:hypothetical protein